jgi:hypothetical protein
MRFSELFGRRSVEHSQLAITGPKHSFMGNMSVGWHDEVKLSFEPNEGESGRPERDAPAFCVPGDGGL